MTEFEGVIDITSYWALKKNGWDRRPNWRVHLSSSALVVLIGAVMACAGPLDAYANERFVRSLVTNNQSTAEKGEAIRRQFAQQPTELISIIEGLDEEDDLAFDMARLCQDGLADLLQGGDYALLVSRIFAAPIIRTRGMLAGVLPRNQALIEAVKTNSDPVVRLLTDETEALNAIVALAEVLSRAQVLTAVPLIRSKMSLNHIDFGSTVSLEASLMRLGEQSVHYKYMELIESPNFEEQRRALDVCALSESPKVMKYLIPWLDRKEWPFEPRRSGRDVVLPPFRYSDVAVHFAHYFRDHEYESGPLRLTSVQQYSDSEIEEVREWWETMRDTDEYR